MPRVPSATLLVGDGYANPDVFMASDFLSPDPVILLGRGGRSEMHLTPFEAPRARKESSADRVGDFMELGYAEHSRRQPDRWSVYGACAAELLRRRRVKAVTVPANFPLATAEVLRREGVDVVFDDATFAERRLLKDEHSVAVMQRTMRAAEAAVAAALGLLEKARASSGHLKLGGRPLTAETLQLVMEEVLLRHGCGAQDIIAAGGRQSADPHQRGRGPLPADAPIVLDVFPYHKAGRYCADITRTFVAGEPSAEIKEMHAAVLEAQRLALGRIRPGVSGEELYDLVCDFFEERGWGTLRRGARAGFTHSLGHGVGLEVHERPYLRAGGEVLRPGMCVTVEPGLYQPKVGGVRIEDLVVVTRKGHRNLARLPKQLGVA